MERRLSRSYGLLGSDCEEKLKSKRVLLFGTGGVGSYALETLARVGVGTIGIVDGDTVDEPDLNRQLIATESNLGILKSEVAKDRVRAVHSGVLVRTYPFFYTPETRLSVDVTEYDYVVDAIDDVWAKIDIITRCLQNNVRIISVMGMGNKLDPTRIEVGDVSKTEVCPLAKAVRLGLRKQGFHKGVKVVFSKEPPVKNGAQVGSVPFVPSVAGIITAGEVIKDFLL